MTVPLADLLESLKRDRRVWLFLDYDGTLAEFAPTPDHIEPQPELIELLSRLAVLPQIRLAVISGRRLDHIEALLPIAGAVLAGTYGIEIREPDGNRYKRVEGENLRPALDEIKQHWQELLKDRDGFFLEDKGWALALHARYADAVEAEDVIRSARGVAHDRVDQGLYRIQGGHRFLEVVVDTAGKGAAIGYLLERHPWEDALPVFIGDDDRDEPAFETVNQLGGISIVVAREPRHSEAQHRLASPSEVRAWLNALWHQMQTI